MAILKDRAYSHGERLPARIALAEARTAALALKPPDLIASSPAMRADGAFGPQVRLDEREGSVFVVEVRGGKDGGHGCAS